MNVKIESALYSVLEYSEAKDYTGYGKFDALNSPLLKFLTFKNKWLRIFFTQIIKLSPINLRPFFGVKKYRNPKGIALFARSYFNLYLFTQDPKHLESAINLLDWLLNNSATNYSGRSWGYYWDWQDLGFYAPFGVPNCVVTCFVGQALLDGYEITKNQNYLEAAQKILDFFHNDLKTLYESADMKCISYAPVDMDMVVMDVSALAGALIARIAKFTNDGDQKSEAKRLINYVVDKQTDYFAWFYTHPPDDSPVKHDNYHTGFILNAILDYMIFTEDFSYIENYTKGLDFYKNNLFLENGAPKWMSDRDHPFDIHGAATGIETFSKAVELGNSEHLKQAEKIAGWAIANFQNDNGSFSYQLGKYFHKKYTLMRWCNAWMAYGLSTFLLKSRRGETIK